MGPDHDSANCRCDPACCDRDRHGLLERHPRGEARRGGPRRLRWRRALRAGSDRLPSVTVRRSASRAADLGSGHRPIPAVPRFRGVCRPEQPEAQSSSRRARSSSVMEELGAASMLLVCSNVSSDAIDDDALAGRAAARTRRSGGRAGPRHGLRGACLGPARQRIRPRLADRARGRSSGAGCVPGQLPHPLARHEPRRDRQTSRPRSCSSYSSQTLRTW